MRVIPKSEISHFLTLDTLAKLNKYKRILKGYEEKYKCTFKQFEKRVKSGKEEAFEEWDDYVEWEAFYHFYDSLNEKLKDLKNGHYKVA